MYHNIYNLGTGLGGTRSGHGPLKLQEKKKIKKKKRPLIPFQIES
jgi:hypothetical protein